MYTPKTGSNAGKKNFKDVQDCLQQNPNATCIWIANKLNLSRLTVAQHLKKIVEAYSGGN